MIIDVNAWIGSLPFRALKDNTPDALVARLDRSGIQMAAVSPVEALFHRHPQPANERLIRDIAAHRDRLIPLATINPRSPHWEQDIDACVTLGMKGVRIYPPYQGFAANGAEAKQVAQACAKRGLPLFIPNRIEDSRQRHGMDPGKEVGLGAFADLSAASPETAIVLTNARGFARSPLAQREDTRNANWFIDLSLTEIFYNLHRNVNAMRDLADFIDEGGAPRIVFGSHVPISYAGAALVKLAILPVDAETRQNIGHRTAAKLLKL